MHPAISSEKRLDALLHKGYSDFLGLLRNTSAIYQTVIIPDVVASELSAASNPVIPAILKLAWVQTRPLS